MADDLRKTKAQLVEELNRLRALLKNSDDSAVFSDSCERLTDVCDSSDAELRQIHELYRMVIENAQGVPYRWKYDSNVYEFMGNGCVAIFGVTPAEMNVGLFRKLVKEKVIADPSISMSFSEYAQAFRDGKLKQFRADYLVITPQGAKKWVSDCSLPTFDAATGRISGSIGILYDITERKLVEQALHQSLDKFESVIKNTPLVAIQGFDRLGVIQHWNPASEVLYGFSAADAIGKKLQDLIMADEASRAEFEEKLKEIYETGRAITPQEWFVQNQKGEARWVYSSTFPILKNGSVDEIFCMDVDITDRKRAEERIEKINAGFLRFAADPVKNIQTLTELAGEILSADFAVYNRLEKDALFSMGTWNTPDDYQKRVKAEGHVCCDVIQKASSQCVLISNLLESRYAQSDVNVRKYDIRTYAGHVVKCGESAIGALSAVYRKDFTPSEKDFKVLGILSSAIGIEEDRLKAQGLLYLLGTAVEQAMDGIAVVDLEGNIQFANQSWALMHGFEKSAELTGHSIRAFHTKEQMQQEVNPFNQVVINMGSHTGEMGHSRADGVMFPTLMTSTLLKNESGEPMGILGIARDLSDLEQVEHQLKHSYAHDNLTGLPNRALFMDRLQQMLLRFKRHPEDTFAVLNIDLDRFKIINDSLGHLIGDQILIQFSERLKGMLRSMDTFARLGGDEFAILIAEPQDISHANLFAQRILENLKKPFTVLQHNLRITASIGIVCGGRHYSSPDEILRDADAALNEAKKKGRNSIVVFDEEMRTLAVRTMLLEQDLRQAIENDELFPVYQPIISIQDGRIHGMEALMRWRHPKRGILYPAEFLPLAEDTGLIISMDSWMLRAACLQAKRWQQMKSGERPLFININLSPRRAAQPGLLFEIEEILTQTGLDANSVVLEFTESALSDNPESVGRQMNRINALGVHLVIDDFGTGYSSLERLLSYPIEGVKIAGAFMPFLGKETRQGKLVPTILGMARAMGLNVTAEGVETESQLTFLKEMGCDYIQGFYLSKYLFPEEATALLYRDERW